MARIIYPEDFLNQELLLQKVVEHYNGLPATSNPLTAFLAQQNIVLADDVSAANDAGAFENERRAKAGEAENCTQRRDMAFGPVFGKVRDYYQFLKKFYGPNFMELNLWGAPITTSGRIAYPSEFTERLTIYHALKDKYAAYAPGASPLDPYLTLHGQSMADNTTAANSALAFHNQAKDLAGKAEDATQDRNNVWLHVMEHLRAIGGFLISLYNTNPKELNRWGFTVDDSPRAPKQVKSKVKLLSHITVGSLIIGGTFRNIGTVPLTVYKGSSATGPSVIVNPGELYGITKGGSTITVVNPSSTTTGEFSALRHK
jgi:hypothetical protein